MPSSQKDHVAHQAHPHEPKEPGGAQLTAQELTDNVKNHKVEELAKKSEGDFRSEELAEAKKEGRVSETGQAEIIAYERKLPTHPRPLRRVTRRPQERMRMLV